MDFSMLLEWPWRTVWVPIGLCFSLGAGRLVAPCLTDVFKKRIENKAKNEWKGLPELHVSPKEIGFCESLFFTLLVAFNIPATAISMMAWIGLKVAANWNLISKDDDSVELRSHRIASLLGSLASMGCAVVGGLICRGGIPSSWR